MFNRKVWLSVNASTRKCFSGLSKCDLQPESFWLAVSWCICKHCKVSRGPWSPTGVVWHLTLPKAQSNPNPVSLASMIHWTFLIRLPTAPRIASLASPGTPSVFAPVSILLTIWISIHIRKGWNHFDLNKTIGLPPINFLKSIFLPERRHNFTLRAVRGFEGGTWSYRTRGNPGGANLGVRHCLGRTPLCLAATRGCKPVVQLLF